jgi:hypothetical protein
MHTHPLSLSVVFSFTCAHAGARGGRVVAALCVDEDERALVALARRTHLLYAHAIRRRSSCLLSRAVLGFGYYTVLGVPESYCEYPIGTVTTPRVLRGVLIGYSTDTLGHSSGTLRYWEYPALCAGARARARVARAPTGRAGRAGRRQDHDRASMSSTPSTPRVLRVSPPLSTPDTLEYSPTRRPTSRP